MDEERDYVVFTDEDGNEFELDVIRYFDYKDNEYAILADCSGECECCDEECDDEEGGLYVMRIIVNEEDNTEEFVPPEDEDMDELIALAEQLLGEDDCCCGEDCDCTDEECEACDHDECKHGEHHCDCGCEDK